MMVLLHRSNKETNCIQTYSFVARTEMGTIVKFKGFVCYNYFNEEEFLTRMQVERAAKSHVEKELGVLVVEIYHRSLDVISLDVSPSQNKLQIEHNVSKLMSRRKLGRRPTVSTRAAASNHYERVLAM